MNQSKQPERERKKQQKGTGQAPQGMNRQGFFFLLILALVAIGAASLFQQATREPNTEVPFSAFMAQVRAGNVREVTIEGQRIRGSLAQSAQTTDDSGQPVTYTDFRTTYPASEVDSAFIDRLSEHEVEIRAREAGGGVPWLSIVFSVLPLVIIVGLFYVFMSRMRSQGQQFMGMGKSRAKLYERNETDVKFGDVAGGEGAKRELQEVIEFLKAPERFERLGGQMPTGVLLVGPPGTGKTLLARAVAGEAEVPFFNISGSDFMEMFVGVGASRVRDMFNEAKKSSPSIIFIDELDSIGRQRGAGLGGGHDEREQTLNQLLSEMDGFEPNENVIVMAATNRPDVLDPALLRPGRFDRRITVNLPTKEDRRQILQIHARGKPLGDDVDLERVARSTPGFSGAELEELLNEAALLGARREKSSIEMGDIDDARDKILMGLKRENLALTEEEVELLAYHEGGHALLGALLPKADPLHKVTIVPRGKAMGVTQQLPDRELYLYRKDYIIDRLVMALGGRAAEELVFDTATSGAEDDLKRVTQIARRMVLEWGMGDKLKNLALGGRQQNVFLGQEIAQQREYSDATARIIDEEIQRIVDAGYERARNLLQDHRQQLDALAQLLQEEEEISGERVLQLVGADAEGAAPSLVESE